MSVFITLPKQPRATDCSNYRTISMMPHTLKIFLKIIQHRIDNKIDKEVGSTQFGFRPGSGTREGISVLTSWPRNTSKLIKIFIPAL